MYYDNYAIASKIDGEKKYLADSWKEGWTTDLDRAAIFVSYQDAEDTIFELGLDENECTIEGFDDKEDDYDEENEPCCLVLL